MQVPFINLSRTIDLVREETERKWSRILASGRLVDGPEIEHLERELAAALDVKDAVVCASGTDALFLALRALGIGPGARVAIPNLTFWATYEAVCMTGAEPILIDIDPYDLQLSLEELQEAHEAFRLDAVILVHLFGFATPQLNLIREYCARAGVALLEDGAQAFGVRVHGRSVFAQADVATLSFYPTKVIGGCTDGGAVLFNKEKQAEQCRLLRNHGRSGHYSHSAVGLNSRLNRLQAAYLLEVLKIREPIFASRRKVLDFYTGILQTEEEIVERIRVISPDNVESNGYLVVLGMDEGRRSSIEHYLAARGVETCRTYPAAVSDQKPAAQAARISSLSVSVRFCREVLNLPLFAFMRSDEMAYVAETFREAVRFS